MLTPIFGSSTGATPFSRSIDGCRARRVRARYEQLNMVEEKTLTAIFHSQLYKGRVPIAFDMKRNFEIGNLILEKILPNQEDTNGKWTINYKGSYIVKNAFSGGTPVLQDIGENVLPRSMNTDAIKRFNTKKKIHTR
ncbi:hypothetical protein Lal_00024676 [Lupinus albus]|nr:hypothetical protein Lal_00024676 [Lupinus albus]